MLVICSPCGEGDAELLKTCALALDGRGVGTEELREHLSDHAGHVVAVFVEVAHAREPAQTRGALELMHAART
jgi:hypothetical protein